MIFLSEENMAIVSILGFIVIVLGAYGRRQQGAGLEQDTLAIERQSALVSCN